MAKSVNVNGITFVVTSHRQVTVKVAIAKLFRFLAVAYVILLVVLALYAWGTDIALLHSPREHLLPDCTFGNRLCPRIIDRVAIG